MKRTGPTHDELLATLRALLKTPDATFKEEQETIIGHILASRDVLAIMPTGGGKSACYQVPAMHLPGITLVISPLLALMEDQVTKLKAAGFPVACLASTFIADKSGIYRYDPDEDKTDHKAGKRGTAKKKKRKRAPTRNDLFRDIYNDSLMGYKHYKLLYVTPERLRDGRFIRFAQQIHISMIAVDEAHCVSLWGYDFRPRYLEIFRLMRRIDYHPIIAAFTATATPVVRDDIAAFLTMNNCRMVGDDTQARENLKFSVRVFQSDEEKLAALLHELRTRPGQCGYVFCSSVVAVNKVYGYLRQNGIAATRYFADLDRVAYTGPQESKETNFQSFLDGSAPVMVCTNALGMGIDKADVRFAFHYNMPLSLENYYQEAGRAGRDGKKADCVLFYYAKSDAAVCNTLLSRSLSESELPPEEREHCLKLAQKRLKEMRDYARTGQDKTAEALQADILSYFHRDDEPNVAAQAIQRRKDTLARLKEIDVLYVNSAKVAHALRQGYMEKTDLNIARPSTRLEDPLLTISYRVEGERLDYFDLMIADAVYTLMCHRVPTIRAKGVMELLSGNSGLLLQPERKRDVEERMRKMTRAQIVIDRTKAAGYGFVYGPPGDKLVLRGPFLPLWEKGGGFGYDPRTLPPLYELAEILGGQFFSLPTRLLHVKKETAEEEEHEYLPATDRNLIVTHYLLTHINMISAARGGAQRNHPKRSSPVINPEVSFKKLCKPLGLRLPDAGTWYARRDAMELRKKAIVILNHFKAEGAIQEFVVPLEASLSRDPVKITRYALPDPPQEIEK